VINLARLDAGLAAIVAAANVPGAAIAVANAQETLFANGYGYRDLPRQLPMTAATVYPIASTTKALNATLLGMLNDERLLAWDSPVQKYLPTFRLSDMERSRYVTLRDLVALRTGLPRHDVMWLESRIDRSQLVERLPHLPLSAGLRERFQYNNLSPTVAGHIAEIVTRSSWEALIQQRILDPLQMRQTVFAMPAGDDIAVAYHENSRRERITLRPFASDLIAPAGGAIHSTVSDMACWITFNLRGGCHAGMQLIAPNTLRDIHTPCVVAGGDATAPSPSAAYGLGWFVDTYNGRRRLSHTGRLHDVHSCVALFPDDGLGIVSFTNFAPTRLASVIGQCAFDLFMGLQPKQTVEEKLAQYERNVASARRRNESVPRVKNTCPSHPLQDYVGVYQHAGYGEINIGRSGGALCLSRHDLVLQLEHWHYDAWVVAESDLFEIHAQHAFERANRICFEVDADGDVIAFTMQLEPTVAAIRFVRRGDPA
jgi:CubicO group peptidase (beta-lactamase class C family)